MVQKEIEKEAENIKKETRKLLEKFSIALKNIKSEESYVEREEDRRAEKAEEAVGEGKKGDEEFRKIMFENAQQKNEDFIIAEKKTW